MSPKDNLKILKRHEERTARWENDQGTAIVIIEKVYLNKSQGIRAKIATNNGVKYVDWCELTPF